MVNLYVVCIVQLDASKAGPGTTNEGVLANFFNSLLSKKTGASPGGPKGTGNTCNDIFTCYQNYHNEIDIVSM